jgi:predicted nucleotidyltransferase
MNNPLEEIVDRIVQGVQPSKIILFGSYARGNYEGKSDYDICVIKEGVEHRRKLAQQIYRLLYGVGVPVDIIVETPKRFDELKDDPFLVYKEIAEDGKVLYEKPKSR